MSSLAASRADGFYFPPEYLDNEVNKKMGLSKYQGSKGANQYQQRGVIRFELPFDAWCLKCKRHMSKGLRFNAKKDKCGNYFSTTIFSFTTKCPSCDNRIVIKTDPKNNTYDYSEGIRKHEQDYEPEFGDGIIESTSGETKKKLAENPMFKLQHDKEDKERALSAKHRLANLEDLSNMVNKPDYDKNALLRNKNRSDRKRKQELLDEGAKLGLSIPLVEPSDVDVNNAKQANFRSKLGSNSGFEISRRVKAVDIQTQSIFGDENDKKKQRKHSADSSVIASSSSRKNEKLKLALKKQAVHKINIKDIKLQKDQGSKKVFTENIKPAKSKLPTSHQIKNHCFKNVTPTPSGEIENNRSGALSLLSGLYDSEDSD